MLELLQLSVFWLIAVLTVLTLVFVVVMEVGSPSSLYSATLTDLPRRTARRRSSRRQRPSPCPTTVNQQALTSKETTTLPAAMGTRTASWATNFDNLLHDCAGLATFSAFLRDEYSEENAIFWQKCQEFRKSTDAAYRKQLARLIYVDHVAESSADQVNIDANVRLTVERRLSTAPVNLFDDAQRQVYVLMKYDSYPRFLRSPLYCEAVNAERLNKRLEVPASDNTTSSRHVGGSLLSRLRQKWKGARTSKLTAKDDSGHGTSLSSLGSDSGDAEHSRSSGSVEDTTVAVTPATLFNRLLRHLSASKSTNRDNVESSTRAKPISAPTARRNLFFDRWRRCSTDVDGDDDARSVSTVASSRTTVDSPCRRARSSDCHRRRLSGPVSHIIRSDADERRRFAAVMSRLAAADSEASVPAYRDTDRHRRRDDDGNRTRSAVTNEVRRRLRRGAGSKLTDTDIEYTIYFV